MEYMYNVYNFNTASYEPRQEKICLRRLRPRHIHKTACTVTEASFGIKERTYVTISESKALLECTVYKRTETFCGVWLELFPSYQYV